MRIFVLFILCFFSFIFFPFGFLVWKFDVLFVDLLVFVFSYGHSKQTRSLLLLVHGVQSVTLRFYPRPENLFLVTDGRSEGGVPANTLKRLVRKRKYKNIFQKKNVFRGRIRTPTDEEKYYHNSDALSTELL